MYDAWRVLSIGRPVALGMTCAIPLPLPAADILAGATAYGFEPVPFLRLCRELDAVYLAKQ